MSKPSRDAAEELRQLVKRANANGFFMDEAKARRETKFTAEDMDHTKDDSLAKDSRDEGKLL